MPLDSTAALLTLLGLLYSKSLCGTELELSAGQGLPVYFQLSPRFVSALLTSELQDPKESQST